MQKKMKNCVYCGDSDKTCDECDTIICEECYEAIHPYDDDPFYVVYLCKTCAQKGDQNE